MYEGCNVSRVLKPGDLTKHVQDSHPELFSEGSVGCSTTKFTMPLKPFAPTIENPPQIRANTMIGLVPVRRNKRRSSSPPASQMPVVIPRRPRQLTMSQIDDESSDVEEDFENLQSFSTLLRSGLSEEDVVNRFMVVGRPDQGIDQRLSGPPPLVEAGPYQEPPPSILFKAFAKKVAEMGQMGTSNAPP